MEVLQHNTGAISVYKKLGFEVIREFYYFRCENEQINHEVKVLGLPYKMQPIKINAFLKSKNIEPTGKQFEMIKNL